MRVSGSVFGGVSQYVSGMTYRTSGALKAASYGSGLKLSTSYNIRQQINEYKVSNASGTPVQWSQYQYHADGKIKFSQDKLDDKFENPSAALRGTTLIIEIPVLPPGFCPSERFIWKRKLRQDHVKGWRVHTASDSVCAEIVVLIAS